MCADDASTHRVHQHCQALCTLFGAGIMFTEVPMNGVVFVQTTPAYAKNINHASVARCAAYIMCQHSTS